MTTEERTSEKRYLTTKEFIRKVKDLGFDIEIGLKGWIWIADERDVVAVVERNEMYKINTDENVTFNKVAANKRKKLFDLLFDYASTPLKDREEEQRFYLKTKIKAGDFRRYLNFSKRYNRIEIGSIDNTGEYQTQFTQKEIDDIKKRFGLTLSDFEQIPVEEVDK